MKSSRDEQAIFALACAERTAIVFRLLAAPASAVIYDQILDRIWNALRTKSSMVDPRGDLLSLPEADIDDSHRVEYNATFTLGILELAIKTMIDDDANDSADVVCCLSFDLCSGLECDSPVDSSDPSAEGPLAFAEVSEQAESLRLISEGGPRDALCDALRNRARDASRMLEPAILALKEQA